MLRIALIAAVWVSLTAIPVDAAERRIALVIDNSTYGTAVGRLSGPATDAASIQQSLQKIGFQVDRRSNLGRDAMRQAMNDFAESLERSGKDGVAFLYYAGHGVADNKRGENFLLPVDAAPTSVAQLPLQALALGEILDSLEAAGAKAAIVVVDACRDVPFAFQRGGGRGLVNQGAKTDTLIAYATSPGSTAADNGLFARVLANELLRPGATPTTVFDEVVRQVAMATSRQQVPRIDNGLVERIVLSGTGSVPVIPAPVVATTPPIAMIERPSSTRPPTESVSLRSTQTDTRTLHTSSSKAKMVADLVKQVRADLLEQCKAAYGGGLVNVEVTADDCDVDVETGSAGFFTGDKMNGTCRGTADCVYPVSQ